MNLDFNFDGKTKLRAWWKQIKTNLQAIQTEINTHKSATVLDHPDKSVTTKKIADYAVGTTQIALGAVNNNRILNGAVNARTIEDGSITGTKIAGKSISDSHLADKTITGTKIADKTIDTNHLADGLITGDKISDTAVTGKHIADKSITGKNIADHTLDLDKFYSDIIPMIKNGFLAESDTKHSFDEVDNDGAWYRVLNPTSNVPDTTKNEEGWIHYACCSIRFDIDYRLQIAINVASHKMFVRNKQPDAGWSAWMNVADLMSSEVLQKMMDNADVMQKITSSALPSNSADYDFTDGVSIVTDMQRMTAMVSDGKQNITTASSGVGTTQVATAHINFGNVAAGADSVTIEYDSVVSGGRWYISVCDLSQRPGNMSGTSIDKKGIVFTHGTSSEGYYRIMNSAGGTVANKLYGDTVHIRLDIDFTSNKISYSLSGKTSGTTVSETNTAFFGTASQVTGIEFYSWSGGNTTTIDNLHITARTNVKENALYLVPDSNKEYRGYTYIDGEPQEIGKLADGSVTESKMEKALLAKLQNGFPDSTAQYNSFRAVPQTGAWYRVVDPLASVEAVPDSTQNINGHVMFTSCKINFDASFCVQLAVNIASNRVFIRNYQIAWGAWAEITGNSGGGSGSEVTTESVWLETDSYTETDTTLSTAVLSQNPTTGKKYLFCNGDTTHQVNAFKFGAKTWAVNYPQQIITNSQYATPNSIEPYKLCIIEFNSTAANVTSVYTDIAPYSVTNRGLDTQAVTYDNLASELQRKIDQIASLESRLAALEQKAITAE